MISDFILKLQEKTDLTYSEMNNIMTEMLSGRTNNIENVYKSIIKYFNVLC